MTRADIFKAYERIEMTKIDTESARGRFRL